MKIGTIILDYTDKSGTEISYKEALQRSLVMQGIDSAYTFLRKEIIHKEDAERIAQIGFSLLTYAFSDIRTKNLDGKAKEITRHLHGIGVNNFVTESGFPFSLEGLIEEFSEDTLQTNP